MDDAPGLGLYIHVPFCERICPYCDFPVVAARRLQDAQEERVVDALLAELAARRDAFAGLSLETVYVGGGTPSLLRPASIAKILAAAREGFPGEPDEVTLEANPGTLERERLAGFQEAGVGRLSVGVQSFDDEILHRLGRAHRGDEARATLAEARRAGFEHLSLDLIVAAPGQDVEGVRRDVAEAVAHGPEHVSAYVLTVEPGTPLERAVERGRLRLPGEEETVAMMHAVRESLAAAGLHWYEISSYARPGREALHNQRYWRRAPVLGIGMGAHSMEPAGLDAPHGARTANERELAAWLARVEAGGGATPPVRERLDESTARAETAFLGLRTARGLVAAEFTSRFGESPRAAFGAAIDELCASGLLLESEVGDLRLSPSGWLLADTVAARFV